MKAHANHHLLDRGATESKHNDFGEMAASVFVQPAHTRSAPEMMGLDLHITYLNILGHVVKEGHYCVRLCKDVWIQSRNFMETL